MTSTDIYSKLDSLDQPSSGGTGGYTSLPQSETRDVLGLPVSFAIGSNPDPQTAQTTLARLNQWATAAPALKPEMLLHFSQVGIAPTDPVGQWLIRTAVPALGSRRPVGQDATEADAAASVLSSPTMLAELSRLPLDKLTNALRLSAVQVAQMDQPTLERFLSTGDPSAHHGFWNKVGDYATTGVRGALTGLSAGYEGVQGAFRARVAEGSLDPTAAAAKGGLSVEGQRHAASEAFTPRYGTTLDTGVGGTLKFGTPGQTNDILGQTTLGQALRGNDLGGGFFPAGAAHEQAVLAQQAAASINGHALTPGRALASSVVQPGSRPYSIMSGIVDTAVALRTDPAAIVLSELSDVAKASRLFAPTSDAARMSTALHLVDVADSSEKMQAIRAWAGGGDNLTDAMLHKLKTDPGSLQQLVDQGVATHAEIAHAIAAPHAGMFSGLRQAVSSKDALTWLNAKPGREYADWAASHDFTDIWKASGKKMPADVAARLADATNADEVRSILGGELGTTIRGVPTAKMPFAPIRPFETVRWGHYLPKGSVDVENGDHAVEQAMRTLIGAKVPKAQWDDVLRPIASATNQPEMFDAYVHGLGGTVKQTLIDRGVEPSLARTLTRFFPDDWNQQHRFFVDEVGNTPHVPGLTVNGAPVPIDGPHLPSELLNRSIPALDMRSINRQVGLWGKAYHTPGLNKILQGTTYLADSVTGVFKAGALLKMALPVRFLADEQARMATAGLDSMFHNPLSYIAYTMGKGETDILGEKFIDSLGDAQSTFRAAVGSTSKWKNDIFQPDQIFAKHWVTYDRGTSGYLRGWGDELSQLHVDPVSREVARAVQNIDYIPASLRDLEDGPHGLDAVKQWFWDGTGQKYRQELAAANLWGGSSAQLMHDRHAADAYIESVVDRVKIKTGGHDSLIDAVADGAPFKGARIDKEFTKQLGELTNQEIGPLSVKGRAAVSAHGRPAVVRHVVDRMFSALMDTPTQKLTRSPAFVQAYWDRVGEIMPYLDNATQEQLLRVAKNTGINLTKPTEAQGVLGLEQADQAAKAHALKKVRDLLYYPGERVGATEALRNIAPFGEAWRNVLTRWVKLAAENPVAVRRVQQGVTSLREGGFFFNDPADGIEKFTMVPGDIMQHLAGVPFPLAAPVKGLNIVGTGLPGVGPAVQIPAAAFMPREGPLASFRKYLMPYGDPEFSGGALEAFFPGWLDKLKTAGWMLKVGPDGTATGSVNRLPFLGQTSDQARILDNLAKQVFQYKMSSGSYDIANPDVLNRLTKDSLADAQKLYMIRGMAQFAAPAAPNVLPQTQLKDGSLVETWKLTNDYRAMRDAHQGDSYAATRDFIDKYGPNRIFATEPLARRVVFGVPTTAEGLVFKNRHSDFVNKFPTTYGYFAPQGGPLDYQAYLDEIKRGELEPLSVTEWAKLADARLGNAIYDQARQKMPASPTVEQRNWLDGVKAKITQQYPGFNDDSLKVSNKTLPQTVEELRKALLDPTVKGTPLAEAAHTYIDARDQALAAARKRTGRSNTTLSGQRMDDLRQWLYQAGTAIAMQRPTFTNMWNSIFQSEVEPTTPAVDYAGATP